MVNFDFPPQNRHCFCCLNSDRPNFIHSVRIFPRNIGNQEVPNKTHLQRAIRLISGIELYRTWSYERVAARPGFEPGISAPKADVLPLHYRAVSLIDKRRLLVKSYRLPLTEAIAFESAILSGKGQAIGKQPTKTIRSDPFSRRLTQRSARAIS